MNLLIKLFNKHIQFIQLKIIKFSFLYVYIMIIIFLIILLVFLLITNKDTKELFIDEYIPDLISVYKNKFNRYLKSSKQKKILLIGLISQKKLDFFMKYFNNSIIYVYNEDNIEYKNIDESIIQNENYPFMIEEVEKLKSINNNFDIILTQGQITIDNFKFIAKNYINLLDKNGILFFENIQSLNNISDIIDSIPLSIKNKFEIYDLRRVTGKYDNICIIVDLIKNNL